MMFAIDDRSLSLCNSYPGIVVSLECSNANTTEISIPVFFVGPDEMSLEG
jgi:hypothetical protein